MKLNSSLRLLLQSNPDSIEALSAIGKLTSTQWIYDLSGLESLNILGLSKDKIYSEIQPIFKFHTKTLNRVSKKRILFDDDAPLNNFLTHSESKQDVIKPFCKSNLIDIRQDQLYIIQDARIICTPLSICIIDSQGRIVKQASHNAAEALYLWELSNHQNIKYTYFPKAILGSVQQTFNIGHWFIDSISRIAMLKNHKWIDIKQYHLLIDTVDHSIIKSSLSALGIENSVPTLPYSYFKVKELIVPIISSFDRRVDIASEFMQKLVSITRQNTSLPKKYCHKRIFLSRQNLSRRKILNWPEIEKILNNHHYHIIFPEEISLFVLNDLLEDVESIVGPNGSAFCNMLLNDDVKQSIGIIYPHTHLDDYYYRTSQAMGKQFFGITNKFTQNKSSLKDLISRYYYPSVAADYWLDPNRLEQLLIKIG